MKGSKPKMMKTHRPEKPKGKDAMQKKGKGTTGVGGKPKSKGY